MKHYWLAIGILSIFPMGQAKPFSKKIAFAKNRIKFHDYRTRSLSDASSNMPLVKDGISFHDHGTLGLSDVTIDTPPLRDQVSQYNQNTSSLDPREAFLQEAREFFSFQFLIPLGQAKRSNLIRGAVGLCVPLREGTPELVVEEFEYTRFGRPSKTKTPFQLTRALDLECQSRGKQLVASYVPF